MKANNMNRQEGYYWVKVRREFGDNSANPQPKWIIREWCPYEKWDTDLIEIMQRDGEWADGHEDLYRDEDIIEINETQIPSPEGQPIVRYDLRTAYEAGFKGHPQKIMEGLGYRVINYEGCEIGDCVFIKVNKPIYNMPKFCDISTYEFIKADIICH